MGQYKEKLAQGEWNRGNTPLYHLVGRLFIL